MNRVRATSSRTLWIGVLLGGVYISWIAAIFLLGRQATLRPVFLEGEDLLLGPEEPVQLRVRVVDGSSGRPIDGVSVRFWTDENPGGVTEKLAVTGPSGIAVASFPRSENDTKQRETSADSRYYASLGDSHELLLASPWGEPESAARWAVLDALLVQTGMEFFLVDLDGWYPASPRKGAAGDIREAPPTGLMDRIKEGSSRHDRTLYLTSESASSLQQVKFWLMSHGFPAGLLLRKNGGQSEDGWLEGLPERLVGLGGNVRAILASRGRGSACKKAFPSAEVTEPDATRSIE